MKKRTLELLKSDATRAAMALAMAAQCEALTNETCSELLRLAGEILDAIQRLECDYKEGGNI